MHPTTVPFAEALGLCRVIRGLVRGLSLPLVAPGGSLSSLGFPEPLPGRSVGTFPSWMVSEQHAGLSAQNLLAFPEHQLPHLGNF